MTRYLDPFLPVPPGGAVSRRGIPWVLIVLAILPGAVLGAFALELLWRAS